MYRSSITEFSATEEACVICKVFLNTGIVHKPERISCSRPLATGASKSGLRFTLHGVRDRNSGSKNIIVSRLFSTVCLEHCDRQG